MNTALPIIIDFETYYDKDYSLKKLTTEEYIRCDKFEVIGVSIMFGSDIMFYRGERGIEVIRDYLARFPNSPLVSHNARFDMGILGLRYDLHPKYILDTVALAVQTRLTTACGGQSLARIADYLSEHGFIEPIKKGDVVHDMLGIHASDMSEEAWQAYGDYCLTDTRIASSIYWHTIGKVSMVDLAIISSSIQMFTKPTFKLNLDLLEQYKLNLADADEVYLQRICDKWGFKDIKETQSQLRSIPKFAELLARTGISVPTKYSEKQQKDVPAVAKTDLAFQALLEHENPDVVELVQARLGSSKNLARTRCQSFIDIAKRGDMPIPLVYHGTHTGRYSATDKINCQNLPKRGSDKTLRRSMTAPKDHVVIACDLSQIELRVNALISGETRLIDLFKEKRCPYCDMASFLFGIPYDTVWHEAKVAKTAEGIKRRNMAKEVVLASGYSMSATTFATRMKQQGLYEVADMADQAISTFRTVNKHIVAFWRTCTKALQIMVNGGTMSFGGTNNNLFYADGSSEFWGKKIPSIRLPDGNYLCYPNLQNDGNSFVYEQTKRGVTMKQRTFGGSITENLCQAMSFSILKYQASLILQQGVPLHLNVHDEWVSVVHKDQAISSIVTMFKAMQTSPAYVPYGFLDCEIDVGVNYADMSDVTHLMRFTK